jgi:hypothetical protein
LLGWPFLVDEVGIYKLPVKEKYTKEECKELYADVVVERGNGKCASTVDRGMSKAIREKVCLALLARMALSHGRLASLVCRAQHWDSVVPKRAIEDSIDPDIDPDETGLPSVATRSQTVSCSARA